MLRAAVMNQVGRHVHAGDVVTEDDGSRWHGDAELTQQLAEPAAFSNDVGDGAVLRFSAGIGDRRLPLG
jgi:hypothetical protein